MPRELADLFEVAKGLMCYGYFFYPVYTVGSEQMYRVLDAALVHRCQRLEAPRGVDTFFKMIHWLSDRKIISHAQKARWEAARHLRNRSSHAIRQSIYDPTAAARSVEIAADLINELFASDNVDG